MYLKHFTFLSILLLLTLALPAQISITGAILAGGDGGGQNTFPVPEFPVLITSPNNQENWTVYTDSAGTFSFQDTFAVTAPGDIWTVATFDPCSLLEPSENIVIEEGNSSYSVVFNICTDFHPPAPLDTCIASLSFELFSSNTPTVQFHNTSTTTQSTSVAWDFGDGQNSVENNPLHTYEEYGSYEVTLTITGDSCVATTTETVQVDSIPCDCDITFDLQVCVVDEVTGEITVFGDICDAFCAGYQAADILICSDCEGSFIPSPDPSDSLTISFQNTSIFTGELDSVLWDFGDGSFSNEFSPTHTYAESGNYQVILRISTSNCGSLFSVPVTVGSPPSGNDCSAFYLYFQPDPEDLLTFSFLGFPNDGTATSMLWDFGDGQSSSEVNPFHTYAASGFYEVILTITVGDCVSTYTEFIEVEQFPCGCQITSNENVCVIDPVTGALFEFQNACEAICAGYALEDIVDCPPSSNCEAYFVPLADVDDPLTITFQNNSIFTGELDNVTWDFADGSFSNEFSPTHTYAEPGTYQVVLTISQSNCGSIYSIPVSVGPSPTFDDCQAFFVFDQPDPENLLTYQFFGFSLTGTSDSMSWDFGNGVTSTESSPLYTYNEAGTYQVSLTIFSGADCVSTLGIVINVGDNVWYGSQECRASFLPLIIGDSTEVYFWNTSSSDAISYEWDFGDGNTSTEFEPFYVFPAPAVYTVTLTTTNQDGCVNEYMVIIDLANNNFTSMPQFTLLSSTRATSPAAEDIKVFPNPSPAIFTIGWSSTTNSGSVNWQLMDISGRVIEQRNSLNTGRFQIDLGDRPDGIYFLRMESETGTTTKRLIKS
jgi:PKD repeat protein